MCRALSNGIVGIFGPQTSTAAGHVQSICDSMEIPHVESRWDYKLEREGYSINLYPHPQSLGQVTTTDVLLGWIDSVASPMYFTTVDKHDPFQSLKLKQRTHISPDKVFCFAYLMSPERILA